MLDFLTAETIPFQPFGWTGDAATVPRPAGGTVLLVDDEQAIRSLGMLGLCQAGHIVLTAASGLEALELVRTVSIDLIVLDLVMPGLSGQETLARLHATTVRPPVLLSSGFSDQRIDPNHLELVLGFLKKPYRPSHLQKAVRLCLDESLRRRLIAANAADTIVGS